MTVQITDPDTRHADVFGPHPGTSPHLRAGLIELAEYLVDLDEYPEPWALFHAFLPWQTREHVEKHAAELLREVVGRYAKTASDFDVELALDYLTGVRR